jgi:glycosyltransferase involved in cell wall biosynthesis
MKRERAKPGTCVDVEPGFKIRVLYSPSYRRHIGFRRLAFEHRFAREFRRQAGNEPPPDVVIVREPPGSAVSAVFRATRGTESQVVIDVFDTWPELFRHALPAWAKPFDRMLFRPMYARRSRNLRRADATLAVCETYLELAFAEAPELRTKPADVVFIGIDVAKTGTRARAAFEGAGERPSRGTAGVCRVIYAGTFGLHYDIQTVLAAAARLRDVSPGISFVFAGTGPWLEPLVQAIDSCGLRNVTYLGHLHPDQLSAEYELADVALCSYSRDSTVAMPTKIYDYLAAGLPVLTSLPGEAKELLLKSGAGLAYEAGNAASLAAVLERVANDPGLRANLAANSRRIGAQFDESVQYAKVVRLVRSLVAATDDE